jgi:hypothetical protein
MEHIHQDINKTTLGLEDKRSRAARASRIRRLDSYELDELEKQIKALQRAIALERGENYKFREEIRALLRSRL